MAVRHVHAARSYCANCCKKLYPHRRVGSQGKAAPTPPLLAPTSVVSGVASVVPSMSDDNGQTAHVHTMRPCGRSGALDEPQRVGDGVSKPPHHIRCDTTRPRPSPASTPLSGTGVRPVAPPARALLRPRTHHDGSSAGIVRWSVHKDPTATAPPVVNEGVGGRDARWQCVVAGLREADVRDHESVVG